MKQEKKEEAKWYTFIAIEVGMCIANLIFIFYCMAFFFNSKFGYGAATPAILLYIFANIIGIMILTAIMNAALDD